MTLDRATYERARTGRGSNAGYELHGQGHDMFDETWNELHVVVRMPTRVRSTAQFAIVQAVSPPSVLGRNSEGHCSSGPRYDC